MTAVTAQESPSARPPARARILDLARDHLFDFGYTAFTMDGLAAALGMSKKTLYVHFRSKDAIIEAVLARFVADVRASADEVFNDPALSFPLKLHRFSEFMVRRFAQMQPHVFRDLQRSAPHIYRHIEELRHQNIPRVFGQIVRQGQAAGMVRADLDPAFAIEFLRPAMQSLMHPDTLERLKLPPDRIFAKAMTLFFNGLLTPAGRKDYEKHQPA
ncbi:MAG: TetR/AcrR family transcriptional regulator [Opitutales bacterium]